MKEEEEILREGGRKEAKGMLHKSRSGIIWSEQEWVRTEEGKVDGG